MITVVNLVLVCAQVLSVVESSEFQHGEESEREKTFVAQLSTHSSAIALHSALPRHRVTFAGECFESFACGRYMIAQPQLSS
jgi:hypothetical protein